MPKKKKKTKAKTKRRKSKKAKKRKSKKIKKQIRKKVAKKKVKSSENNELIIKTRPEWIKASLANKPAYHKKYNDSIKNNNEFWKKEGKE